MKFATLIALVAVAQAQEEDEAMETLEQGADCSAEGSMCGEGLCCGTAAEVLEEGAEGDGSSKTVCSDSASAEFVDEEDPDIPYSFACNTTGEEGAAKAIAASAAALLAVAYLQ